MPDTQQLRVLPDALPRSVVERVDVAVACRTHDFARLFSLIKQYGGVSQNRIAAALDLSPSRVGEIIHGRRRITSLEVITRISDRFAIPGRMLGLAERPWEEVNADDAAMAALVALDDRRTVPLMGLGQLAGSIIDLDRIIDIDIDDNGDAILAFYYRILNLTGKALTRLPRDLWFQYTSGHLAISADDERSDHLVTIQRVHDTPNLAKFACLISPPIKTGGSATVAYRCAGGRFLDSRYWRQAVSRFTRQLTMNVKHRGAGRLLNCAAIIEHADGTEHSATEDLNWASDHGDVTIALTCRHLRPGQAVTLRWETDRAPS